MYVLGLPFPGGGLDQGGQDGGRASIVDVNFRSGEGSGRRIVDCYSGSIVGEG